MKTFLYFALLALTTFAITSCVPPTTNTNVANTNTNTNANTTAAAPTAEQLKALETKAYEAYKNKDGQYFQTFLAENFKMTDEKGAQMDKAASIKGISEHPCQINGFTLSDEKVTPAGPNAAVLTTTVAADGTCEGKPMPTTTASTLYINVGGQWKAAYHGEIPKTGEGMSGSSNSNTANKPAANNSNASNAAKPAATATPKPTATPTPKPSATPASNSNTTASSNANSNSNSNANATSAELNTTLVMAEKTAWQAWKDKQSGPLEDALAKEFFYVNMDGTVIATKADVIKDWTTGDCDVKSFGIENPQTVQVTDTLAFLTYKGTVAGTCAGTPLKPVLGTTIFVKEGMGWKAVYGTSQPAA